MLPLPPAGTPGRHALHLLAICLLMTLVARGVTETYAIFLLPLSQAFGWERTAVSGVYSVTYVVVGTAGPAVGWLFDRWGPMRLYLLGIGCMLAAVLLASFADALWQFYLALGLLLGIGTASLGAVPTAALLSRWFRDRLNSALAVAYAAGSTGMMVFAPTTQLLIDAYGWRVAYQALALPLLGLLPLALLVWRLQGREGHPDYRRPAQRPGGGPASDPGLIEAFRNPALYGLVFTFAMTGIGMYTVVLQTPAFLVEQGYSPSRAAQAFGAIGLLAPAGMIGFGWVGDRFGRRRAVLFSYAMTVSGILSLVALATWPSDLWLAAFIALFGGSFGSRGPAISAIAAAIFRGPAFGRIYGVVTIGMGIGGGLGAFSGGFWHDLTGGYVFGMCFAVVVVSLGTLPFLLVRQMARA